MLKSSAFIIFALSMLAADSCPTMARPLQKCSGIAPLPKGTLTGGLTYGAARKRILAAGFVPDPPRADRKDFCVPKWPFTVSDCKTFPELGMCSADGYCAFYFRDPMGNRQKVVSHDPADYSVGHLSERQRLLRYKAYDGGSSCAGHGYGGL